MSFIEALEVVILVTGLFLVGYCNYKWFRTKDGSVRLALIWIFASYWLIIFNMLIHLLCRIFSPGYLEGIRSVAYVIQAAVLIPLAWLAWLLRTAAKRKE